MQIEHSNEVDLIRQTLAGDTSAFDRLVKIHRGTVYVLVLSYTKNPADAEDVTQRIFIRAYERLATLRELDRFPLWLQQIAHNACKDWLRRRNNSAVNLETVSCAAFMKTPPTPEEIALKREIEVVVREAIGALQETDRKLVEGRYIEGASYDELQVESGLSYSAIASRLKRAKQQMRRRIEKLLGGMAVLPGRTFIWGGIETVKLSMKAKLAMVGVVAVLGIGGGVWYHHTFESNPVIVNEQRVSEPEAVTEDRLTEIQKTSTAESTTPEDWEQLDAFIASLKALDEPDDYSRPTDGEHGHHHSDDKEQHTENDEAGTTQEPFIGEIDESLEPYKRTEVYRASLIEHFGDIPQVHTLADSALKGWLGIYYDLDEAIKNHEAMVHLYPGPSDAAEQLEVLKKRKQEQESGEVVTYTESSSPEMLNLKTQYPELGQIVNQYGPDGFREAVRRFSELNPEKATAFKRALWNTPEVQNALKSVDATELEEIKEFFGDIMTGSQK